MDTDAMLSVSSSRSCHGVAAEPRGAQGPDRAGSDRDRGRAASLPAVGGRPPGVTVRHRARRRKQPDPAGGRAAPPGLRQPPRPWTHIPSTTWPLARFGTCRRRRRRRPTTSRWGSVRRRRVRRRRSPWMIRALRRPGGWRPRQHPPARTSPTRQRPRNSPTPMDEAAAAGDRW